MTPRSRELLAALVQSGGFLGHPLGFEWQTGMGVAGIHGDPRPRMWDAAVSAHAPDLTGDTVSFVALPDGTLVVEEDVPDDSLASVADALEATLQPPYRAAGLRAEGDVWTAVAEKIEIAEIRLDEGDVLDLTVVDGQRELTVDGERTIRPIPALDVLAEEHGEVVLHAERVDGNVFAVDVFPL